MERRQQRWRRLEEGKKTRAVDDDLHLQHFPTLLSRRHVDSWYTARTDCWQHISFVCKCCALTHSTICCYCIPQELAACLFNQINNLFTLLLLMLLFTLDCIERGKCVETTTTVSEYMEKKKDIFTFDVNTADQYVCLLMSEFGRDSRSLTLILFKL